MDENDNTFDLILSLRFRIYETVVKNRSRYDPAVTGTNPWDMKSRHVLAQSI